MHANMATGQNAPRREMNTGNGGLAKVCVCGNEFLPNASFCRHCGAGRKQEAGKLHELQDNSGPLSQGGQGGMLGSHFSYNPPRGTLTIGQHAEFWPNICDITAIFRLLAPLPIGLNLDSSTGVIHGTPAQPSPVTTTVVEATLANGTVVRTSIDFEVIDFTRGGFVIGHISEVEPGKFMLLLYVPESSEGEGNPGETRAGGGMRSGGSGYVERGAAPGGQWQNPAYRGGGAQEMMMAPHRQMFGTAVAPIHSRAWQQ